MSNMANKLETLENESGQTIKKLRDSLDHTIAMLEYEYKNSDGCPEAFAIHFRSAKRILKDSE